MKFLNLLHDKRVDCYSVMVEMPVSDFLNLVEKSYENRGGIEGQRSALKTKTALTIRNRMVEDVKKGTVLPAIVLGVHIDNCSLTDVKEKLNETSFQGLISRIDPTSISIIDGMQRTTALQEAKDSFGKNQLNIRVEFWISDKLNSLIYRMLVLNTGQVPWEMARQLETVYSQLLKSIQEKISIDEIQIFQKDDKPRRLTDTEFEAHKIIQLYMVFASRRYDFNLKDKVAEDFARLDTIETNSIDNFVDYFVRSFELLYELNKEFSRATQDTNTRIKSGADIFSSDTALTGFFAAVSVKLFKKPGYQVNSPEIIRKEMESIVDNIETLLANLRKKNDTELVKFLALNTLDERLNQKSGQVGKFERDLFFSAFTTLINEAKELEDLDPCWMVS
jgi:hypothetical protein